MHFLVSNVLNVKSNFEHSENKQGVVYCQTPTEVFSQKLGVDFVFTRHNDNHNDNPTKKG